MSQHVCVSIVIICSNDLFIILKKILKMSSASDILYRNCLFITFFIISEVICSDCFTDCRYWYLSISFRFASAFSEKNCALSRSAFFSAVTVSHVSSLLCISLSLSMISDSDDRWLLSLTHCINFQISWFSEISCTDYQNCAVLVFWIILHLCCSVVHIFSDVLCHLITLAVCTASCTSSVHQKHAKSFIDWVQSIMWFINFFMNWKMWFEF